MARILTSDPVPQYLSNLFASKFSQRVRNVSQKNFRNMVLTNVAALMMDSIGGLRKLLFDKVISDSRPLAELLADPAALERHVRDNVQSAWHRVLYLPDGRSGGRAYRGGSTRARSSVPRTCSSPMRR